MMKAKLLFLGLAAVFCGLSFTAQAESPFHFTANGHGNIITGYSGPGGAVVVPEAIDDMPVVSIGDWAFAHCVSITSVVIPDTVTDIGEEAFTGMDVHSRLARIKLGRNVVQIGPGAFSGCDQLKTIIIPESVRTIGEGAFDFCSSLTNIDIPAGVTNIGAGAFNACFGLESFTVDPGNPAYTSVDGVLYNKDQTMLVQFPGGKSGEFVIPNSVTNIAHFALWNCPNVTSIRIPEGITEIGDEEFAACSSLATVFVPASVTHIGQDAFNSCISMRGIYFKGNAPDYGEYWRGGRAKILGGLDTGTIYYVPGTTGWGATFGDRPTAPWKP